MMSRTCLTGAAIGLLAWLGFTGQSAAAGQPAGESAGYQRPNVVFAIADDWGWPHAGACGDRAVRTPNFDAVAEQGVLFRHAFVSSPSCTPSRGAIIAGQHFWRLGAAANLWSEWPADTFPEYPQLLAESGYFVGHYRKAWGPGKCDPQPAGPKFPSPEEFFEAWPGDRPFCFWFGASDPHRGYDPGSGQRAGIPLDQVHRFGHFPDTPVVRSDIADYYFEVQRFDRELGQLLQRLRDLGVLENTIVVVTGDHGMPFPRCKTNLYDGGTRVPLAIRGPGIAGGRSLDDFVSLTDLAPTFLQAAGVEIPSSMTGHSLWPVLQSESTGQVDPQRDHVIFGRERHTVSQQAGLRGGYPMRGIRTPRYLYIRNYEPDRWPAGTPDYENAEFRQAWLSDCDNGPTKRAIWEMRETDAGRKYYEWCFGKRPAEELYDLSVDPDQLTNVAEQPGYQQVREQLSRQMHEQLVASQDPRATGADPRMDEAGKYRGGGGGQWTPPK
jgi:arylsulfatase A-like enzyme